MTYQNNPLNLKKGSWRVEGVKGFAPSKNPGNYVYIVFSKLKKNTPPSKTHHIEAVTNEIIELRVHSCNIFHFIPGSIWSNGILSQHNYAPVKKLTITPKTEETITLQDLCSRYNFTKETHARLALQHSLYSIVDCLNEGKPSKLVIPCSELLRFNFGVSTRIISAIVQNRLSDYCDIERLSPEGTTTPEIWPTPKKRLSRLESCLFAEYSVSPHFRARIKEPHNHLSSLKANQESNQSAYQISAKHILTDEGSEITVKQKFINRSNLIWASEILTDKRDVPFKDYNVVSQNMRKKSRVTEKIETLPPLSNTKGKKKFTDQQPFKGIARASENSITDQFSCYQYTWPKNIKSPHLIPRSDNSDAQDYFSFEDGSYENADFKIRGIDHYIKSGASSSIAIETFLEMIANVEEKLTEQFSDTLSLVTRRICDDYLISDNGSEINILPDKCSQNIAISKINRGGSLSPRQLVICEILEQSTRKTICYLAELESSKSEKICSLLLLPNSDYGLIAEQANIFITLIAIKGRLPSKRLKWKKKDNTLTESFFENFKAIPVTHPCPKGLDQTSFVDKWAEDIVKQFKSVYS